MRFPFPKDTSAVLSQKSMQQCRNLGLWLDKYRAINDEKEEGQPRANPEEQWKLRDETKRRIGASLRDPETQKILRAARERRQHMLEALKSRQSTVVEFTAEPDYRLVLGFGAEHVLETNLSLHRIYGFPVLPGSAVKGIARAMAFWEIAEKLGIPPVPPEEGRRRRDAKQATPLQILEALLSEGDEQKQRAGLNKLKADSHCVAAAALQRTQDSDWQNQASDFYRTFGTTKQRGQVTFFDAYPKSTPELKLDVLNPHYGKYYRDESPPADYLEPVPTYFLTVAKGSPFQFAVVSKDNLLAERAAAWLKAALEELGIGGKTSAGYGFMEVQP